LATINSSLAADRSLLVDRIFLLASAATGIVALKLNNVNPDRWSPSPIRRNRDQMRCAAFCHSRPASWEFDMDAVKKALWYIESHSAAPLTLGDVAEASGLSRFHLSRVFPAATGHSVFAYLRGRRLTEAARTLVDGAPDILAVALDAGYGSHEAFTRAFRDFLGLTPEEVRARRDLDNLPLLEAIRMSDIPTINLAPPTFREGRAMLIGGIRQYYTYEERGGIPAQWQRFNTYFGTVPDVIGESAYGICTLAAPGNDAGFDYTCGVEMRSLDGLPEGFAGMRLPARRYAVFWHGDHISTIGSTCGAIFGEWLPKSGMKAAEGSLMMIEHYDQRFDPRTGEGGAEIWVPVQG
jgi:AraC family transcriptional regulator